jgi:hypothetical protein
MCEEEQQMVLSVNMQGVKLGDDHDCLGAGAQGDRDRLGPGTEDDRDHATAAEHQGLKGSYCSRRGFHCSIL